MVTKNRTFSSLKNPPVGFSPSGLEFSWPLLQPSPLASLSLPQNSTPYHLQISRGLSNKKVKMERNSLSNHSIGGGRSAKGIININNNRVKDSWEYSSTTSEGDLLSGFHPWPPRSYTCSFCKREFRSAQALGGHMNVHRRDRARLRQSPPRNGDYPSLNLNLNSSPNPNPNPDYPHVLIPMVSPSLSTLSSPSSASSSGIKKWVMFHNKGSDLTKTKDAKTLVGIGEFEGFTQDRGFEVVKKSGIVRLDLEIGLVSDSEEEDLDLELRLGRS